MTGADEQVTSASVPSTDDHLQVTFWGVRGSVPVSGKDHLVFGGDTICCEVKAGSRRVIIDAGSGLAALGKSLDGEESADVDIVLTHYHLDHLIGLMSFGPLFSQGSTIRVHAPVLEHGNPEHDLTRLFGKPFFPMGAHEAGARFSIRTFRPGDEFSLGGFPIDTCTLSHPGGACGYRIEHAGSAVVVALDHEHGNPAIDGALEAFSRGADLVLYDASWDQRDDYEAHRGWGHSTWQAGVSLVRRAGAGRLVCLHHAPSSSDRTLLSREQSLQAVAAGSLFARQNQTLSVK